jgi:hypothetical protein
VSDPPPGGLHEKTQSLAALAATAAFRANPALADECKTGGYVGAGYTRHNTGDGATFGIGGVIKF